MPVGDQHAGLDSYRPQWDVDRHPCVSKLMDMLRAVQSLKEGEPTSCPAFFGFKSWDEVLELARSDEGAHLVTFVNLVEKRGERQLMWALNRTVEAEKADLVISTAHKSKGREWKSVRLMDDFLRSSPGETAKAGPDPAEMRLLYVALTRAKEVLDVAHHGFHRAWRHASEGARRSSSGARESSTVKTGTFIHRSSAAARSPSRFSNRSSIDRRFQPCFPHAARAVPRSAQGASRLVVRTVACARCWHQQIAFAVR
ncbi:ATP-binding domain-containing protein [Rhizobium bangladeshense]|uniref:3'-5' exonuclease n=1 Tax=Rhizobium bangladeshense TaxID=1138189 RepID=UPI001C83E6F5|nr:3'-5' exonuclease [Rhizobium bangladeshense]MBX4883844.1 ATP-binding domain-containing protein [Rhizobium bangladeshense]